MLEKSMTVGGIATRFPVATKVFHKHGLDFCCGGAQPLDEACADRGVDARAVLDEIEALVHQASDHRSWEEAPLDELLDHIVRTWHEPMEAELDRLEAMARKVHRVHGDKRPEMLSDLLRVLLALKADLLDHILREEEELFPFVTAGAGFAGPMAELEAEHDEAGRRLKRLREITQDYVPPAEACATWRALWAGLERFEQELMEHIHLENNVLHARLRAQA